MKIKRSLIACWVLTLSLLSSMATSLVAKPLTVYSARKSHLIDPVIQAYEKQTGQKVEVVVGSEGPLLERLASEDKRTQADLLITVDAGNLWQAAERGVLQPVSSEVLQKNIPDYLRDPNNQWFGISVRARTIAYSTKRVKPAELKNYEDLAANKWKGKLCLRTSKKVYNQSLVAMMIAQHGEKKTANIIKGWVENLSGPVFSNDTKVIQNIAAGKCDVGIVNSYYYGRLAVKEPNLAVKLFWPKAEDGGTHVNISGAAVVKNTDQKAEAVKFLEWLSSKEAQTLFAELNMEFPANTDIAPSKLVSSWGKVDRTMINVKKAGELQAKATMLMKSNKYN